MKKYKLYLCLFLIYACTNTTSENITDAQSICDILTDCFDLRLGPRCAEEIEETTLASEIAKCAECLQYASCEEIGEPGEPGICDNDCYETFFGVAE